MEKQYYDLIVSLIQKHSKYPGHESILDDIAEDVYQHARVVITSVTNEDVIVSYLNKVVSNSIVTVGKRNNINVRHKHTVNSVLSSIDNQKLQKEFNTNLEEPLPSPQNVIANEDNSQSSDLELELNLEDISPESQEEQIQIEEPIEESEPQNLANEISDDEFVEKLYSDNTETGEITEANVEEPVATEITTVEEQPAPIVDEIKPDMELVEKMINGVPESSETEISENIEDDLIETLDEIDSLDILSDNEEDVNLEENTVEEIVDSPIDTLEVLEEVETGEENEELSAVEFAQNVAIEVALEEFVIQDSDEDSNMDLEDNEIEEIKPEPLEEITDTRELPDENVEDFVEIDSTVEIFEETTSEDIFEETVELNLNEEDEESFALDNSLLDDSLEANEDLDFIEEADIQPIEETPIEETVNTNSKFSIFAFEPEEDESNYNSDEIISLLKDFNRKHPEYKVLEISEMKYSKNLSISDIAKNLSFTEDKVIEILNEIIDIVKD